MKWRKEDVWIRGTIVTNPDWYQRFCAQHEYPRKRYPKPRTKIKKFRTLSQLDRIAKGLPTSGFYYDCLMKIIHDEFEFRQFQPQSKEANYVGPESQEKREHSDW